MLQLWAPVRHCLALSALMERLLRASHRALQGAAGSGWGGLFACLHLDPPTPTPWAALAPGFWKLRPGPPGGPAFCPQILFPSYVLLCPAPWASRQRGPAEC